MNKENTEYLFKRYPEFFKDRDDMQKSLMGFGFECGDGWFNLISKLCHDIEKYFLSEYDGMGYDGEIYHHEVPKHFNVQQVKEKFGGLRFYVSSAPEKVFDMIHKAESDSYFICEHCGDDIRKRVYNDGLYHSFYRDELGWILTLCDSCLCKHLKERKMVCNKDYVSDWQREHNAPFVSGDDV